MINRNSYLLLVLTLTAHMTAAAALPRDLLVMADYRAQLETIEQQGNFRDARMVEPLVAMSALHFEAAEYDQAIDKALRAVFILRSTYGLKSFKQFEHDEMLLQSLMAAGDTAAVNERLEVRRATLLKMEGEAQQFLAILQQDLDWQRRLGLHGELVVSHALRAGIITDVMGEKAPELAAEYRAIGDGFMQRFYSTAQASGWWRQRRISALDIGRDDEMANYLQNLCRAAEDAYQRGLAVQKANPEHFSAAQTAAVLASVGDTALARRRFQTATKKYRAAFELLQAESGAVAAQAYFASPKLIYSPLLKPVEADLLRQHAATTTAGLFVIRVTQSGRAAKIQWQDQRLREALPPRVRRRLYKHIRSLVFRPRLVGGERETASDVSLSVAGILGAGGQIGGDTPITDRVASAPK